MDAIVLTDLNSPRGHIERLVDPFEEEHGIPKLRAHDGNPADVISKGRHGSEDCTEDAPRHHAPAQDEVRMVPCRALASSRGLAPASIA